MTALKLGDHITLQFTKVLDVIEPGTGEQETVGPTVDRKYWLDRGYEKSLSLTDQCLAILKELVPTIALKYNQQFVGLTVDGRVNHFVIFLPKKQFFPCT